MRVIITGAPRTGKTVLAERMHINHGFPCFKCDDVQHLQWSLQSATVATWFNRTGPWIIEGVTAVRALRKWLKDAPPSVKPADRIFYLTVPFLQQTDGQKTMTKAIDTVWSEVRDELRERRIDLKEITYE